MSKPIQVTDAEFEEKILKSKTPVIVDFWAPWCGPCRMVGPILEEFGDEYGDQLIIAKVNTDENTKYAIEYGVQGIPTMLFVRDGEIRDRVVGAYPKQALKSYVDKLLDPVAQ